MNQLPLSEASVLLTSADALARACEQSLAEGRELLGRLRAAGGDGSLSGEERMELFDEGTALIGDRVELCGLAHSAHPDLAVRSVAEEWEQQLRSALTEVSLDRELYDPLVAVDPTGLDAVSRRWLEHTLRDFRRAGVDRDERTRQRIRALQKELVELGQVFARNIREDVRSVAVPKEAVTGLPDDWQRAHPVAPDGTVKVTTDYPDYVPFMTYSEDPEARQQLWRTFRKRGHPANAPVLDKMLAHREELATLLGYTSWAAYVTEDKMIGTDDAVDAFIGRVASLSETRAQRDYERLLARKREESPDAEAVDPWDQARLDDRIRAEDHAVDSREVRAYFEYGAVKQGVLDLVARLFSLELRRREDAAVWHPSVEAYDVLGEGEPLGRFFLDMHPREGKYKHAAQFTLVNGKRGRRLPEGALLCNFPSPGEGGPALLQHSDVETFLHELGHLVHHIVGGHTRFASHAGVRTEWDFVEAPSQLLEEWAWNAESLQTFARHHETGAPLPAALVERMRAADQVGKGLWARQQLFYAALSLELHRRPAGQLDPARVVAELQTAYTPFPFVEDTYFHLSFGHLDGYSAIYYTYMWSLVIAKDLFTAFEKNGIFDPATARSYRSSVLDAGGSADAAELVRRFLGRDFELAAFERWLEAA